MKEIIDYPTRFFMKAGKKDKHSQGLRPLHTDFINNDESQGYRVTFVKGEDDPHNTPELVEKRRVEKINNDRKIELKEKAENNNLTPQEKDEILKRMAESW